MSADRVDELADVLVTVVESSRCIDGDFVRPLRDRTAVVQRVADYLRNARAPVPPDVDRIIQEVSAAPSRSEGARIFHEYDLYDFTDRDLEMLMARVQDALNELPDE
jgi:hypothetical protein